MGESPSIYKLSKKLLSYFLRNLFYKFNLVLLKVKDIGNREPKYLLMIILFFNIYMIKIKKCCWLNIYIYIYD